ncbi:protocadherin 1 [Echinococcus multilocularis]|uniref:Protocadherin 1 n=1 Tax=Echinococcus multilocularis TaxID=6211 RepID=A0A068Y4C5_ECHMU|nr:protocadherin 1 [Echinococcus multilocularis]
MRKFEAAIVLALVSFIWASGREIFNPNGPEFEGTSGRFTYAIFASVGVVHSKAVEMCSTFYPQGRLAWLSDGDVEPLRAIVDQAIAFHYMNLNNFFWIDGRLEDASCRPQNTSCKWTASPSSHVESGAARSFTNNDVVFHKPRPILAAKKSAEDGSFWPALLPNVNMEFEAPDVFILSAAPGYVEGGFICAHEGDRDRCPFGFEQVAETRVPKELVPKVVTTKKLCG